MAALAPPRLEPAAAAIPRPHTPRGLPPAAATTFLRHAVALTLASSRPAPSPRHPPPLPPSFPQREVPGFSDMCRVRTRLPPRDHRYQVGLQHRKTGNGRLGESSWVAHFPTDVIVVQVSCERIMKI